MATPKTRLATSSAKLAAERRRLQRALAAVTRQENATATANARAHIIVKLDKEVVLVGVSAEIPYRIGGMLLELHEPTGMLKVILRVGNRRWVSYEGMAPGTSHQVYAESAGTHSFSSWIYPCASRALAEQKLDEVARHWQQPSRIA